MIEPTPAVGAAPRAAIHDLGYRRYLGGRRPQSSRWRVIVKNVVAMSWRGYFRMKLWLLGALVTTAVFGILMYVWKNRAFEELARQATGTSWVDVLLPMSYRFYPWYAFVLGITVAAPAVARDLGAGAFEFYFSRPVRPLDYVIGKLGGMVLIMAAALLAGPLLLALLRVGLSDPGQMLGLLGLVPKVLFVGGLAALAHAAIPLAIGSLSTRPRNTIALWVAYYVIIGPMFQVLAVGLRHPALGAVNLQSATMGLAFDVFDLKVLRIDVLPPAWASATMLALMSTAAIALLYFRVMRAERAGLGGG